MRAQAQGEIEDFGTYGNGRHYGLVSQVLASKYGYHLKSTVDPASGTHTSPTPGSHPQAELNVMVGTTPDGKPLPKALHVPSGGCRGEAERALGTIPDLLPGGTKAIRGSAPLEAQISAEEFALSQTAPAVVSVIHQWSACMAERGYHYASPLKAGSDLNVDGPRPTPTEIQVAVTDVTCKQRVHLIQVWYGWEAAYQQKRIDENAQYFAGLRKKLDDQLRRTAAVLAGH